MCQLPVTIDAAFVEFVRTQSLELRVWKGGRASWPSGGTVCGVAKVVLHPLLTTIEGVGGDVAIAPQGGGGVDRAAGSVAARVFFKHRDSGANEDANGDENDRHAGGRLNEEDGEAAAAAAAAASKKACGSARRRVPVTFREEVEVIDEEKAGYRGGRIDGDPSEGIDGAEMLPPADSGQPALGESSEKPESGGVGEEDNSQAGNSSQQQQRRRRRLRQPEGPAWSLGGESERGLEVFVERAMRLAAVSGAGAGAASADPEVVAGGDVSPETPLPSAYVTFRWEEEGKPPLRSPLVLRPPPSTSSGPAGVADGGQERERQVSSLVMTCTGRLYLLR